MEDKIMKQRMAIGAGIAVLIICIIVLITGADMISADAKTGSGTESITVCEDMTGKWYLSGDTDFKVLESRFPDVFAFGCELEILQDGRINWHVGAAGAAGTYRIHGNQLIAEVSEVMEYDEYQVIFTMDEEGTLRMKYKNVPLEWTR